MSYTSQDLALRTNFPAAKKYTLVSIASFASNEGLCKPSVQTIAQRASLSDRTVQRNILELEKDGYIERIYRQGRSALTRLTDKFFDLARGDTVSGSGVTQRHRHESVILNQSQKTAVSDAVVPVAADAAMSGLKESPKPKQPTAVPVPTEAIVKGVEQTLPPLATEVMVRAAPETAIPPEAITRPIETPQVVSGASVSTAAESATTLIVELVQTAPETAVAPSNPVTDTQTPPAQPQAPTVESDAITESQLIAWLATVPRELLEEWGILRKAKKRAPKPGRTELEHLHAESQKAGLTLSDVIKLCILQGWARFEATWLNGRALPSWITPASTGQNVTPYQIFVPPPPVPRLTPEQLRPHLERVASIKASIKAEPPSANDPLGWAKKAVQRKRDGEFVRITLLESACQALGLDRKTLTAF